MRATTRPLSEVSSTITADQIDLTAIEVFLWGRLKPVVILAGRLECRAQPGRHLEYP